LIYSVGTDISESKIHATLKQYNTGSTPASARIIGVDSLDSPSKDKGTCAIVVSLEADYLNEIHAALTKLGMKSGYSEFKPHVSILYDVLNEDKVRALEAVTKGIKNIKTVKLAKFIVQPIDTEWTEKLK